MSADPWLAYLGLVIHAVGFVCFAVSVPRYDRTTLYFLLVALLGVGISCAVLAQR